MNELILVLDPVDNSDPSVCSKEDVTRFCDDLQEKKEIILVNSREVLLSMVTCGFKVVAIVAIIEDKKDPLIAEIATKFFDTAGRFSFGSVTPRGFVKVTEAETILEILK